MTTKPDETDPLGPTEATPKRSFVKKAAFGLGEATGVSVLVRGGESLVSEAIRPIPRTNRLLNSFFGKRSTGGVEADVNVESRQRFADAMVANGLSEADLGPILDRTFRMFWLFAALGGVSLVAGIYSIIAYPPPAGWGTMMLFGRFGATPAAVALAIRPAYLNWITRHRDLRGLGAFLFSRDILPKTAL